MRLGVKEIDNSAMNKLAELNVSVSNHNGSKQLDIDTSAPINAVKWGGVYYYRIGSPTANHAFFFKSPDDTLHGIDDGTLIERLNERFNNNDCSNLAI